jgi:hypothetical protein
MLENRTTDTRIFNPLLYRLSYLAIKVIVAFVESDCLSQKQKSLI